MVNSSTGQTLASFISKPAGATFDIMAIFAVIGIAYSFAGKMNTNKIFGAAVAVVSWFLIMPYSISGSVDVAGKAVDVSLSGIPLGWVGSKGIFVGIMCAFLSVHIYTYVERKGWTIKMPAGVPPTVEESFAALIPAAMVMIVFFTINLLFGFLGTNVFQIIFEFLQTPLLNLGDTLGAMVVAYIFLHLFWFFGVNGGSVVGAVFNPILQTLSAGNIAGEHHIICQQFQDLFATFGGAGSTLSLVIAMLLFCKSKRITNLGKLSFVPGIFGINEPIVFGLPIVLNPTLLIPFVLKHFGIKRVMLIAMLAWVLRFGLFGLGNPGPGVWMFVLSMIVYGVAFDFFNISGSLFVNNETDLSIRSSAQGLFVIMTNGIGATVGTLGAQAVVNRFVDMNSTAPQMEGWSMTWFVFAGYALVVAVLFAVIFKYKHNPRQV